MKKIIFITVLIISILAACKKEKTNQEKMIGNWKRDKINELTGNIVSLDSVFITSSSINMGNTIYPYFLKDNTINFINNTDTFIYYFQFVSETNMKWNTWASNDFYYYLTKY